MSVFNEYCSEKVLRRSNWQQSILRILTLFEKHVKCTLLAFVGSHLTLAVGGGKSAPYNQLATETIKYLPNIPKVDNSFSL